MRNLDVTTICNVSFDTPEGYVREFTAFLDGQETDLTFTWDPFDGSRVLTSDGLEVDIDDDTRVAVDELTAKRQAAAADRVRVWLNEHATDDEGRMVVRIVNELLATQGL